MTFLIARGCMGFISGFGSTLQIVDIVLTNQATATTWVVLYAMPLLLWQAITEA